MTVFLITKKKQLSKKQLKLRQGQCYCFEEERGDDDLANSIQNFYLFLDQGQAPRLSQICCGLRLSSTRPSIIIGT